MLNAPPESESGLPTTSTPAEAEKSARTETMRPDGQDVVSYLRAITRAEPEPTPEPEPRSVLQALLDKTAGAIRSATAIARTSALLKFRPRPARSVSTEAQIVETPPEPVPEASAPSCVEFSVEPPRTEFAPVAAPVPAVVMAPPAQPRAPRLTVLRGQSILWLRTATARLRGLIPAKRTPDAADSRPSQWSRLIAWRGLLQRAVRSAWATAKALPAAIRARMSMPRSVWARLNALTPIMRAKMCRLEQQFSMLIARRRRAASAEPAEPAIRKRRAARPRPADAVASARAARPQPVPPNSPIRSDPASIREPVPPAAPFRSAPVAAAPQPEPVQPMSPFRSAPAAAAPQPEPVFAAAPAAAAEAASVETIPVAMPAAAPPPSALCGEVLPPEPVHDQRARGDEPARVITMQPGVRSAAPSAGSVSRG